VTAEIEVEMKAVMIVERLGLTVAACVVAGTTQGVGATLDRATGAIVGRVIFRGTPVPPTRITPDSSCLRLAGGDLHDEAVVIDGVRGLRNVFVYVKEGLDRADIPDPPATAVVLTQRRCRFEPRVLGVRVGQPLAIVNEDDMLHNVHGQPLVNLPFNIGQPIAGMQAIRTFALPEVMIPLTSDIRPWMKAFVGVVSHQYFAVTEFDGVFVINGVPPGRYTVEAWHETLGTSTASLAVTAGQPATVSFTFAAR
jgi:hypothetical protein